jgi:hypothetical protein
MKNLKSTMLMLLALAAMVVFTACTGADGPAGKDGANGKDGKDGKDAMAGCISCHGVAKVDKFITQYEISKHGSGKVYEEEAGRIACGGCHAGLGFVEAVKSGKDDPTVNATGPINCQTCHPIHTKFDTTDFAVRINAGFIMRHNPTNKTEVVDFGKVGNLCAKCHQARTYTRTVPDTVKPASSTSSYSRIGPHYGVAGNVVANKGLEAMAGYTTPTGPGPHAALAKGCVSCHMSTDVTNPATGEHTFRMPFANLGNIIGQCGPCHTDANLFKNYMTTGNGSKIKADLAIVRRALINKGMLDTTQAVTEEGYIVIAEYAAVTTPGKIKIYSNPVDVAAIINYLYIARDRSIGVHNPPLVRAVVANLKDYLSK